jgi:protein-disulfide isomerase
VSSERTRRLALLGGAAVVALVVVVVAIVISQGGDDDSSEPAAGDDAPAGETAEAGDPFEGITQDGVTLGDPDAPVTMIEFADLQCPFCAQYALDALPAVVDRFVRSGELKLELRLLTFLGPDSERGAEVAAAATLQDRLWQFSELFFENQGPENSGYATDQFLRRLARATPGLDVAQVTQDLDSPAAARLIRQASARGEALGVQGTPSFYLIRGSGRPEAFEVSSLDADSFTSELDSALGGG